MGCVSLDDAWLSCVTPGQESHDTPKHIPTTESTETNGVPFSDGTMQMNAKARNSSERKTHDKTLERICNEVVRMRQQVEDRDRTQSLVLYLALAVVVILLIVVLQSTWKLQHATDCLLWYSRR